MNELVKPDDDLPRATRALARVMNPTGLTDRELVAEIDAALSVRCSADLAFEMFERLVSFYPERRLNDERGYTIGMMQVLTSFPASLVMLLVDPVRGLRSEYFPNVLQVSNWLHDTLEQIEAKRRRALRPPVIRREPVLPQPIAPEPDPRQLKSEAERRALVEAVIRAVRTEAPTPKPAVDRRTPEQVRHEIQSIEQEHEGAIAERLLTPWLRRAKP